MNRKIVLFLLVSLCTLPVQAISSRAGNGQDLGLGVALGQPMGLTAKYWTTSTTAVDAFMGYHFNSNFDVHADYLWHSFSSFNVDSGRLPLYAGVGARVNLGNNSDFGMRVPFGASYLFASDPLELFVEISPVFKLLTDLGVSVDGQVGIRLYINYLK